MTVEYQVPFYSNTPDGTHCQQATLKMLLKYFEPDEEFSWDELDRITAKEPSKATWRSALWMWLVDREYDLRIIDGFNAQRFIVEGGEYLRDAYGAEVADWSIANSNIPQEQELYRQLIKAVHIDERPPVIADIENFLDQQYLVHVSVNSKKLAGLKGFTGHSVLVIGYDDTSFKLHNPGLPPREGQIVSKQLFEAAWAYPNAAAKELFAVRLAEPTT